MQVPKYTLNWREEIQRTKKILHLNFTYLAIKYEFYLFNWICKQDCFITKFSESVSTFMYYMRLSI